MTNTDELRRLLEEAWPRPWFAHWSEIEGAWVSAAPGSVVICDLNPDEGAVKPKADAALIVAAVNALPALLDERDRLLAVLEAAEGINDALALENHCPNHEAHMTLRAALAKWQPAQGTQEGSGE